MQEESEKDMRKEKTDYFISEKCNFQGEDGYMFSQIHNEIAVVKQFILKTSYKAFCDATGVEPEQAAGSHLPPFSRYPITK